MGSILNKFQKKAYKFYIKYKEKVFTKGEKKLKYLLLKEDSKYLVISFSGFASGENKSAYNYIRTLSSIKVNKLFILDDFGHEKRGSYYLGEHGDFFVEDMVVKLIEKVKSERNINKVICVGSSKGGTAAFYFGIKLNADYIIAGAPQYYIGNYLNTDNHMKILESIIGNVNEENLRLINSIVPDTISNYLYKGKPEVFLHYSLKEHTYPEHIIYLLEMLENKKFNLIQDIKEYSDHSEVSIYFPGFLKKSINKIVNE